MCLEAAALAAFFFLPRYTADSPQTEEEEEEEEEAELEEQELEEE